MWTNLEQFGLKCFLNWSIRFPMKAGNAVKGYCFYMCFCGIALVRFPPVLRKLLVELSHVLVTVGFR